MGWRKEDEMKGDGGREMEGGGGGVVWREGVEGGRIEEGSTAVKCKFYHMLHMYV